MSPLKIFAALAVFALAACASAATPAEPSLEDVRISLTRDVCFGFCPAYSVSITGEGEVIYEGRAFVNAVGERRAQIPQSDVAALVARFDAAGFDTLRDEYRANVTDLPTFTLTLERGGRTKTVVDYGGELAGMPDGVRALQDDVDRVAGTARWILRDGAPVTTPPKR